MQPTDYNKLLGTIARLPDATSTAAMMAFIAAHPEWNFLSCVGVGELRVITEVVRLRGEDLLYFIKSVVECVSCAKANCECGTEKIIPPPPPPTECPTGFVRQKDGTCKIEERCPDGSKPVDGNCKSTAQACLVTPHVREEYKGGETDV